MKRTAYNEHIRNIKCSEDFRAKMERALSSPPQEIHEYTDSVQGVERARKFNINRFGTLAAALLIIGGGVGFGMYGMKKNDNIYSDHLTFSEDYSSNISFTFEELLDLYNQDHLYGHFMFHPSDAEKNDIYVTSFNNLEYSDYNMTPLLLKELFDLFEEENWDNGTPGHLYGKPIEDYMEFNFSSPYQRPLGDNYPSYDIKIFQNGDAYFQIYYTDRVSCEFCNLEYRYKFPQDRYEKYKQIILTAAQEESFALSIKNSEVTNCVIYSGDEYGTVYNPDVTDIESPGIGYDLFSVVKETMFTDISETGYEEYLTPKRIELEFNYGIAIITDDDRLIIRTDDYCRLYNVDHELFGDIFSLMNVYGLTKDKLGLSDDEKVSLNEINSLIDENINGDVSIPSFSTD